MQANRAFKLLKRLMFRPGLRPRTVWFGPISGLKMVLDPAHQSQYICGLHEREVHPWLPILAQDVKSAVDIGAAEGAYVLYYLARTGAEKIFAFDPDPVSREDFIANIALNGYANDARLSTSMQYIRSEAGPQSLTLDGLLPELRLPCVIKIDVDGAELDILNGAHEMLRTHQVRWLIETHSADLERECATKLTEYGYNVTIIPNAWWRVIVPEQRPIPHNRWLVGFPPPSR